MKTLTTVVTLITLVFLQSPIYGQWTEHIIDPNIAYSCFIAVHDMGDDGDMDVFVSEYGASKVLWYENNDITWIKHTIDDTANGVVGLDLLDVNEDGNMDVTVACWRTDIVAWYENDGADSINWTKHIIDNTFDGAEVVRVADINGDGALDLVVGGNPGRLTWYENKYPMEWISHDISLNVPGGSGNMYVADINNDDKPDVVRAASNRVVLFMNNLPNTVWTEINIDEYMPETFQAHIADIDNDGDMDVTATAQGATGSEADVAWYENDGTGQTWTKHTISADLAKSRWVYIEDIDNDGFMDAVVSDNAAYDIIVFFNNDGGQTWTKETIDNNFPSPNPVFAYDIDLDNDFDILPTSQNDNAFIWYENLGAPVYVESLEVYPKYIRPDGDTLIINAQLVNPSNHSVTVYATISPSFLNKIELFDDGFHSDGFASDKIFGERTWLSGLPENMYAVNLSVNDLTVDSTILTNFEYCFTTAGPVAIDSFSVSVDQDTFVEIMDMQLVNLSKSLEITSVNAKIITADTNVTSISNSQISFLNLLPGESKKSDSSNSFYIKNNPNEITLLLEISSNDIVYWYDTLLVYLNPTAIYNTKPDIPIVFQLEQNYPNPFNPSTTFKYEIPKESYTTLKVYDILGREVATLVNREQKAGYYEVDWSAVNNSSGIYFYRIQAGDFTETKKMVLIK